MRSHRTLDTRTSRFIGSLFVGLCWSLVSEPLVAGPYSVDDLEFFEKRIRPVLAAECFSCHSREAKKLKGGLYLDTRVGVLRGGDSGPAAKEGHALESRLVTAVEYDDVDLQMPPKSRLSAQAIADLKTWVDRGLPWPDEAAPEDTVDRESFDLAARRASHWAWQPVKPVTPPEVRDVRWVKNPVDAFILDKLEANGVAPAPEASRRSLARRLYLGLTGLPPSPDQLATYVSAYGHGAYERLVDDLLGSPFFGERWGRHWLDLVRYAETMGHEFDYQIPFAWRYRDYVVRALNQDVPYDQLVREHISGDLLPTPRLRPDTGTNESVIGTGFYWLGQQVHSPVDIEMNQLDVIDNQIDVLSKTFLGMTVSCARCHDHKFDAISTKDFYAFYGVLSSSRYHEAAIDAPVVWGRSAADLQDARAEVRALAEADWSRGGQHLAQYMMTGMSVYLGEESGQPEVAIASPDRVWEDFESKGVERWTGAMELFLSQTSSPSEGGHENHFLSSKVGAPHQAQAGKGEVLSAPFIVDRDFLHFLVAGGSDQRRTTVNLLIDGKRVRTAAGRRDERFRPVRFSVAEFRGAEARLEMRDGHEGPWGFISVDHIVMSDREEVFGHQNRMLPDLGVIHATAEKAKLDPATLEAWIVALDESVSQQGAHPLTALTRRAGRGPFVAEASEQGSEQGLKTLVANKEARSANYHTMADAAQGSFASWFGDGPAMEHALTKPGELLLAGAGSNLSLATRPMIHSARLSRRFQGSLRSPDFKIHDRYVHVLVAGEESRVNLVIENFNLIRSPIYGGLKKVLNHSDLRWVTFDLEMWEGLDAYMELKDTESGDLAGRSRYASDGWFAVAQVVTSNERRPPAPINASAFSQSQQWASEEDFQEVLAACQKHTLELLARWSQAVVDRPNESSTDENEALSESELRWLAFLVEAKLLNGNDAESGLALADAQAAYQERALNVPPPTLVPSMTEGAGLNQVVFVRGNPRVQGEVVERGFLEAIQDNDFAVESGSRRMALANEIADSKNPLTARVYVNRVWHHLFGRGIVATPDNFGVLGQPPTHPELLDWLSHWFATEGEWSTKRLIRMLVTSATYRMLSQGDPYFEERDPTNELWHRMPVRRLEGEAIRDTILAVSGDLDLTQFGQPVPVHLTPFMTGRGRPGKTGPLDGKHRRTVYQEVRRNFLSPMMLAFDAPIPHTTFGKRSVSNVPAQALILMNDPFVIKQAERWAARLLREDPAASFQERFDGIYQSALGRLPKRSERLQAMNFVEEQRAIYGDDSEVLLRVWSDLCHVVFNMKEFIFLD